MSDSTAEAPSKGWRPSPKVFAVVGLIIALLALFYVFGMDAVMAFIDQVRAQRSPSMLLWASLLYTILLAIPGVPGLEIGLMMILVFGKLGVLAMYLCSFLGLLLAFCVGRALPVERLKRFFKGREASVEDADSATGLTDSLQGSRLGRFAAKLMGDGQSMRRYLVVAFLLNMPGNVVLGGGGGIAMLCGLNSQFRVVPFALTVLIACGVFPALALLGLVNIEALM